jgi:hypothetical protein
VALEDDAIEAGEQGDDQGGQLGGEARQRLHGVLVRVGASANPILTGGPKVIALCSQVLTSQAVTINGLVYAKT